MLSFWSALPSFSLLLFFNSAIVGAGTSHWNENMMQCFKRFIFFFQRRFHCASTYNGIRLARVRAKDISFFFFFLFYFVFAVPTSAVRALRPFMFIIIDCWSQRMKHKMKQASEGIRRWDRGEKNELDQMQVCCRYAHMMSKQNESIIYWIFNYRFILLFLSCTCRISLKLQRMNLDFFRPKNDQSTANV